MISMQVHIFVRLILNSFLVVMLSESDVAGTSLDVVTNSLINLSNIPNGMVSGATTDELNWITHQSSDRYISEISDSFLQYLNEEENSEEITPDIIKELNDLERECVPKSSLKQMNNEISRFTKFLSDKKLSTEILKVPPAILDTYLRYYYSSLRTKDGQFYAPKTLICVRASIHRYLQLNRPAVNVIEDSMFSQSNRMLKTMIAKFKNSGQRKKESYPVIEKKDMESIRSYFDRSSPTILQQEIIFNLIYYFGLRGRETLPHLTKDSFEVKTSSSGRRYLTINHEMLSKNAKASLRAAEYEDIKQYRMYENKDNAQECPLICWDTYINMISESPFLFPKPSNMQPHRMTNWFCPRQVVGKNSIDNLMSDLSKTIVLSKRYTNHCIRVTMITSLKEHGYSNVQISSISGHKNPHSVDKYFRRRRDEDLEDMADSLQLESSTRATSVHIEKVTRKARIITVTCDGSTADGNPREHLRNASEVYFNGRFENCSFNVFK